MQFCCLPLSSEVKKVVPTIDCLSNESVLFFIYCWHSSKPGLLGQINVVSDHFPTVVCVLYLDCELIEKKIPRKKFKKKRPKINFDHFKSTQINPNFVTLLINQSPLIRFNESLLCCLKFQPRFQCNKLALRKGKM